MDRVNVEALLANWGQLPNALQQARFERLAQLTALRGSGQGYSISNFWRGPLLYALIQRHRPRYVLEYGTGRGYGALSMAMAAVDSDLECDIYTIDILPPDQPRAWLRNIGDGPQVSIVSLNGAWRDVDASWVKRVHCLTGWSYNVMAQWRRRQLPQIDFCFVDGGHDYWTTRHDVLAAANRMRSGGVLLLDDYNEEYGVKQLVDAEIALRCSPGACVDVDMGIDPVRELADKHHYMVYLDGRRWGEPYRQLNGSGSLAGLHHARFRAWFFNRIAYPAKVQLASWFRSLQS